MSKVSWKVDAWELLFGTKYLNLPQAKRMRSRVRNWTLMEFGANYGGSLGEARQLSLTDSSQLPKNHFHLTSPANLTFKDIYVPCA